MHRNIKKYNQTCPVCGKHFIDKKYPNGVCQSCYSYFRKGGIIHELPPKGVIKYDEQGKIICHICGQSHTVIGTHVRQTHKTSIIKYKELFDLCNNSQLTEKNYHNKMRNYAFQYDMPNRLKQSGKATQIKKGDQLRLGKQARKQECLAKQKKTKN